MDRSFRVCFAALTLAALAGCSSAPSLPSYVARVDPAPSGSLDGAVTEPVRGGDVSLAIAQMPESGGAVSGLREKFFANGVRQEIILASDRSGMGENKLEIAVQTAAAGSGGNMLAIWRPTEAAIKREIVARYPAIDMQIVTQPRKNALGTLGLAIGRHSSGVRCVFAWQWVEDIRNPGSGGSTFGAMFSGAPSPASVRIHICRKDATVDDLASAAEGMTLAPAATLDRALDPGRRTTATASGSGNAVAGGDGSLESALTTAVRPKREPIAQPSQPRIVRHARRVIRRRVPAPESAASAERSVQPVPVYQSGPRYMGMAGVPAGMSSVAPGYAVGVQAAPGAGASPSPAPSRPLDPSLPAAAYRGPSGQRPQTSASSQPF